MRRARPTTLLILACCLLATVLLVVRERPATTLHRLAADGPSEGRSHFAVLDSENTQVGAIEIERRSEEREAGPGHTTRIDANVRLDLLGVTRDLSIDGELWVSAQGQQAQVRANALSDGTEIGFEGTVLDGLLSGSLRTGGELVPVSLPIPAGILASGIAAPLDLPLVEPGQRRSLAGFDPVSLAAGRIELEGLEPQSLVIDGETILARVVQVQQGGVSSRLFLDDAGEMLRAETPFGLTLERRASRPLATADAEGAQIVSLAMVSPGLGGAQPHRGASRLVVRLGGTSAQGPSEGQSGPQLPTTSRQRRRDDGSFEIVANGPPAEVVARVDPPPAALAPEPLVQSDHPRIRETAEEIVAGLEDPWDRATAIGRYLFDELDKTPTASIPSALQVLDSKAGDCNEHTVLFTALARAVGIPTQMSVGLVWSETHQAFAYHAWPEVWIGDRFVALDPTLGEDVADATHLTLLSGGLEQWLSLGAWIGTLEIEVLEVE